LSRIAIIDTEIDPNHIKNKAIEYIDLCGGGGEMSNALSHGTICAMVLEHCAVEYELVNIRIFQESIGKVFGELGLLCEALKLCRDLRIDVVSLSAVTSILSDSRHLFGTTNDLLESTIIVSALDNRRYMTVPTAYPHVIGVRNDSAGLLSPGDLAYSTNDPYNANVFANCDFPFLRRCKHAPSNSFAVPVVVSHINNLLNQGLPKQAVEAMIYNLKPYPLSEKFSCLDNSTVQTMREVPIVFVSADSANMTATLMDELYEKYKVQSSTLSLYDCPFDVRIKVLDDISGIKDDVRFMEKHYKTDLIFICGEQRHIETIRQIISIDVELMYQDNSEFIMCFEDKQELVPVVALSDKLHEILTV